MSDVAQRAEGVVPADEAARIDTTRLAALVASDRPATRPVISPVDGGVVGEVPVCTAEDVAAAVARAREAQRAWADTSVRARAAVIRRFGVLVLEDQDRLMDLATAEAGKARKDAFEEVGDIALAARWFGHVAHRVLRPRRVAGYMPVATHTTVRRRPKGVIGVISPWNYPLTLAVSDLMPALLAGNGVVLKPDSQTPFCALALVELLYRAGVPRDLVRVVTGPGTELGPAIVDEVDGLMFTGSTETGRVLAQQCGRRLITFSAELGGKNAMLVLPGADPERTAEGAVRACFSSSGQVCVGIERIFVADAVHDAFVEAFVARVSAIRVGTGWDADMGPLASAKQLERVTGHVRDAVEQGATVLTGGRARPDLGPHAHEPTVLVGVTSSMRVAREETFGPVVSVHRFGHHDEALDAAHDTPYGLNASIWGPVGLARRLAARLHVGTVNVNDGYAATWASHAAPMGGTRDSGMGRRHGRESLLTWTEPQTVAVQRFLPSTYLPGLTAERYARVMTAAIRLWRRVPAR
ncbi:succinic semialdehyde dehydrogenase [Actinotalea sp. M2MS4P-6]|uniref:succinic semialdehyde dehydrogenase n=1 Tax=Actinotalea sp. M2MS4P-6 TaxID=2983762 RepID=UPI0021E47AD3|nr:succinic semialdehyde dehydrogenase [Actinotalea sp. M2MS4P-6]MCV2392927.1 succinic semialdehyde dehydrogenase [Actinotalea sp. M2MS4P-6]